MSTLTDRLREELKDPEYREGYDEAFLDHVIATQIKVIREQRRLSQAQLATLANMKQSRISEIEDENYGSWSVNTLRRIAYALGVRLRVYFEEWSTLLRDVESAGRGDLERHPFEEDSEFCPAAAGVMDVSTTVTALPMESARTLDKPLPFLVSASDINEPPPPDYPPQSWPVRPHKPRSQYGSLLGTIGVGHG